MEYKTADGHVLTDEMLEEEARLFERGERPGSWGEATLPRSVNITLPAWVVASADTEAARLNISRRAVFNVWLADKAEQANAHRRELAKA